MSTNVLLTPKLLTRATLANLGDGRMYIARNMSTEYSRRFGQKTGKIGDTYEIRKPQRFLVSESIAYAPQPLTNIKTPVKVDQWAQVAFDIDTPDATLSIEDVQTNYAKPAAIAISANVNQRAAKYIALNTANACGTPGTTPTTLDTYLTPMDILIELGLPEEEDVLMVVNRRMQSKFLSARADVFNPTDTLSKQYKSGELTEMALGYKWAKDQMLYSSTTGTYTVTGVVDGANQVQEQGDNATGTLVTKTWTACGVKAGDRFTLAGVYAVHPQTRASTGRLKTFLVIQDATSTTAPTLSIYPAITPSGQYQNVTASPADGAAITMLAATGTSCTQAIAMANTAYAFLSVPMENPSKNGVDMAAQEQDPKTGLNLAMVRQFQADTRQWVTRFDSLFGFGNLYRENAVILYSA